jgi:hypothetical protein
MKHHLVILSMIFYLAGTSLSYAAQAFCSPDGSAVSVLLAEENGDKKDGDKKDGGEKNPEDDCE